MPPSCNEPWKFQLTQNQPTRLPSNNLQGKESVHRLLRLTLKSPYNNSALLGKQVTRIKEIINKNTLSWCTPNSHKQHHKDYIEITKGKWYFQPGIYCLTVSLYHFGALLFCTKRSDVIHLDFLRTRFRSSAVFADVVSIYKFSRTRWTVLNNKIIITIIIIIINATYSWDHLHTQDTTTPSGPPCHHLSSFFENFNLKKNNDSTLNQF